jgi:hypothetical protein
MQLAGSSDEDVEYPKTSPYWSGLRTLAPTPANDAACRGDDKPPTARLSTIAQPALVVTKSLVDPHISGLQPGFFDDAAEAIATTVPNAERRIVEGRSHAVDPNILVPVLERFFLA